MNDFHIINEESEIVLTRNLILHFNKNSSEYVLDNNFLDVHTYHPLVKIWIKNFSERTGL